MIRTIEQWKEIFSDKDCYAAAEFIFCDIPQYQDGRLCEDHDIQQLANALEAWHEVRSGKTRETK